MTFTGETVSDTAVQTLVLNGLRGRVKLQVDGQLRTGRDIVVAAMLGADEFAFGTSMLVALGCVQCRNCNLNCCPVGIATQDKSLRGRFSGKPEHLQRYFRFLAEEVREQLAALGFSSLADIRGRVDLLVAKKGSRFDFGEMLAASAQRPGGEAAQSDDFRPQSLRDVVMEKSYDARELMSEVASSKSPRSLGISRVCRNVDRSVGTVLSGYLVAGRSDADRRLTVDFTGVGGQSFGAFLAKGITFNLRGEANDYVGKGLSGGVITIAPPSGFAAAPEDNVIAGNVIAYGATSGSIVINGLAGERFGIRNSGATLVVEGVGDHGCEYMTGGAVVVIGSVGVNFAAGMTGGVAYVYDEEGTLDLNSNLDSVDIFPVEEGSEDERALLALLEEHIARTGSPKASRLVADWRSARPRFAKVLPVVV